MTLFDRLLIRSYLRAYFFCLVSILSLYIVVDLFTHIDDFAEHHSGLAAILKHIGSYYGFMITQYFDRLCEVIALMAGAFTVAWMQRHNELMPLLSAGVSTQRVVGPVLAAAWAQRWRPEARLLHDQPAPLDLAAQVAAYFAGELREWSLPLVQTAIQDPSAARRRVATGGGKARSNALRTLFSDLVGHERGVAMTSRERMRMQPKLAALPTRRSSGVP